MSEIERLFGTLSFEDTTVGKIFENTQTKRPQTAVSMLRLRTKFQTRHKEVSKTETKLTDDQVSTALITSIAMRLDYLKFHFF